MGITFVDVDIANVGSPDVTERVRLMVDSGAAHSVIPRETLERLGITSHGSQTYQLANGATMSRRKGTVLFRYKDRVGGADAVFGEPGDALLLGAFTLEALGLGLNPLRRELVPIPMMLAPVDPPDDP